MGQSMCDTFAMLSRYDMHTHISGKFLMIIWHCDVVFCTRYGIIDVTMCIL